MKRWWITVLVIGLVIVAIIYLEAQRPKAASLQFTNKGVVAPEFAGIEHWINSEPLTMQSLRGKVVLVDFWTYTCINCLRTLPHLVEWDAKYRDKGLVIVGVHTPEFNIEKVYENVVMATKKYGITYPVAQDNEFATWTAYQNRYWPHKYLIDKDGVIRYDHIGEGAYDKTEEKIKELLKELGQDVEDMPLSTLPDETPTYKQTPELYLGYEFALPRGQNIGNADGFQQDMAATYTLPMTIEPDVPYLEGQWESTADYLRTADEGTALVLDFTGEAAHIVADALDQAVKMDVLIDGQPVSKEQAGDDVVLEDGQAYITVDEPRLYNVVKGVYGTYTLRLVIHGKDVIIHSFTFG